MTRRRASAALVAALVLGPAARVYAEDLPGVQLPAAPPAAPGAVPAPGAAPPPPVQTSDVYRVGVGDELQVLVYGEASLSGTFPVTEAGALNYPLLGAVPVRGLTANEVKALLEARLTPGYLVNPNVTVWVASYRSQPVQVLGDVARPGLYFLRGPTSVLDILSEAGGVNHGGANEVRLNHGGAEGALTVLSYDELVSQKVPAPELAAGDIVVVPPSVLTVMGQVSKPGEIAFRSGMTISQCIAAAGGALPVANLGNVTILRGTETIRVDVRRILRGKAADVVVQPGDRVYVNESVF